VTQIGVMAVFTVLSVFGWLTLLVNAVTLVLIVLRIRWNVTKSDFGRTYEVRAQQLATLVTVVASLGSLYLSEIGDLIPCRWCWIQRTAMYPLAMVLLISWITGDRFVRRYAVPMAILGLAASTWHYLVQQVPALSDSNSCSLSTPCSVTYIEKFGFISIPWMAGSVFLLTLTLLLGFRPIESPSR
jgi:disulfide bond formation protein DsbB